jgi:phospholipase/carboxylesterase
VTDDPHARGPVARGGAPLSRAGLAMFLLHGRGGSARDMLVLAEHLALPDVACVAPEAAGNSWWPQSFLAPIAANEPGLSSSLATVERVAGGLERQGFGRERTVLLGFSQGACLALEHAARSGGAFRAVVGLSGGLVGTADADGPRRDDLYGHAGKRFDYAARLDGVPVFLGCHERDPHIPLARVRETEATFAALGACVAAQIYPGAGHGVVEEEVRFVRGLLNR